MQKQVTFKRASIRGQRPNLSAQRKIANEVVSALSVQLEETAQSPLSTLPATHKRRRKPFGLAIAAAILLFAPLLYPSIFSIFGVLLGKTLPLGILLGFFLIASILSNIGSLLLYIAARRLHHLRASVGGFALALLVLQIDFILIFLHPSVTLSLNAVEHPSDIFALINLSLILLCMIALCVFSVLMLARLFKKKRPGITE